MMTQPISYGRPLAALVIACAMAAFFAQPAQAQTATNLNCSKCVDKKDIDKGAVTKNRIKKGAVNEKRLSTDLQTHVSERQSFYAVLDGNGSTETIFQNDTFTVFARCLLDFVDPPGSANPPRDFVQILATSTVSGWFGDDGEFPIGTGSDGPFNAGDQVIFLEESADPGVPEYDDDIDEFTAAAPNGAFVAVDGEATGLGLNIFGHDCIAIGNVYSVQGTL